MDCKKIKPLLADYINHDLSKKIEIKVKNHIEKCENCKNEITFLKKYFTEIKNIEKIKAPEDLLNKIHERLEEKINFKKALKKLFAPIQIKITIQIAAVAAVIFIIILLFNPIKKLFLHEPQITEEKKESIEGIEEKEKDKTFKDVEKKLIKPQKLYKVSMILISEESEDQNPFLKKRGIDKNETQANIILKENYSKIVELIISLDGIIISPENYKNTKDFYSLIFNIPEKNYKIFIENLNKFGTTTIKDFKDNKESYDIQLKYNK